MPAVHVVESDLIRMRTREGPAVAKARGRLKGKQPKLTAREESHLVQLHAAGDHSPAELSSVGRSTLYRAVGSVVQAETGGRHGVLLA